MPSGSYYCFQDKCGIFFWGANSHDAVWHLALTTISFKQYPFIMPNFSGALLIGYNYLLDLIIYLLTFIGIPAIFTFFKIIPLVWFIVFTALLIRLGRMLRDSVLFIIWLLFFAYFGSSFAFVFPLYHDKTIWGTSSLLSMQSGQVLTNMPFALSLLFILSILVLLKKNKPSFMMSLIIGLCMFITLGLKFYGGFISIVLVFIYYIVTFFTNKKTSISSRILPFALQIGTISICIVTAIFFFYNPFASIKTGSVFIFSPFATMHSIIEEPALFYLKDMVNARYFLYAHGISPRLIFIEIFSSIIFLFFSLGLRLLGIIYFMYKVLRKKVTIFDLTVFITTVIGYIVLVLFTQKGQWWNTVQFYYYVLFLLNIFTAEFFYEATKDKKNILISCVAIFIAVILTLPGNIDIMRSFVSYPAPAYISKDELQALSFLKKQPNGVVFAPIYDKKIIGSFTKPFPLYTFEDTAYISSFSQKQSYIADQMQNSIMGIDDANRLKMVKTTDCAFLNTFSYVYLIKSQNAELLDKCYSSSIQPLFWNGEVAIYAGKK